MKIEAEIFDTSFVKCYKFQLPSFEIEGTRKKTYPTSYDKLKNINNRF